MVGRARKMVLSVAFAGSLFSAVGVGVVQAQQVPQAPLPPPVPASCETNLAVWKENAQNFFLQILALEGQNREVRLSVMKLTQERDAALVKVKASEDKHSKAVHEPKEASKE